ncbi:MAG: ABC transporter substrate-binding protein [Patescibacteria group bacterium]|jgi:branched-chain amino acid transport system substrate-binding protein
MKNWTWVWGVLLVVIVVVGLSLISTNKSVDKEPIKIGLLAPLTGNGSDIGINNKKAFEVAVAEVNAQGGVNGRPFQVVVEDSQGCDPKVGATAMQKLVNIDKVTAVYSIASGVAMSSHPIAEQGKVVHFSCASNPTVTTLGDYMFRTTPSDSFAGQVAADYIFNQMKIKKVAVLNCDNDWCVGLKNAFKERFVQQGGSVVIEEQIKSGAKDIRTELAKIKTVNPELIYFPSYPIEALTGFRQAKELGINVPIFGGDVWLDEVLANNIAGIGGDKFFTTPAKNYSEAFKQKIGGSVSLCAPDAYDIPMIWAKVLKKTGTDPESFKNALYKMAPYQGESGVISFDANGDLKQAVFDIKSFADGAIKDYQLKVS